MENNIEGNLSLATRITDLIKKNKKLLIVFLLFLLIFTSVIIYYNFHQNKKHEKISEQYIKAGILLSSKEIKKSNQIYKEIIFSKNKFYSLLSLNNIIDNDLEKNHQEVLKLFEVVEEIKTDYDQKYLVKLKKALYLIKISKDLEGNNLIQEIIASNSIWRDTAIELSK